EIRRTEFPKNWVTSGSGVVAVGRRADRRNPSRRDTQFADMAVRVPTAQRPRSGGNVSASIDGLGRVGCLGAERSAPGSVVVGPRKKPGASVDRDGRLVRLRVGSDGTARLA